MISLLNLLESKVSNNNKKLNLYFKSYKNIKVYYLNTMSVINIFDVCEMISKNSFEGVKEKCESIGICVKEKSVSENDLYLLANTNANTNENFKNNFKNNKKVQKLEVVQEVPEGDQEVPEGDQEVPVGDQEVPEGDQEVPVVDQEVPEVDQEVPVGDQEVPEVDQEVPVVDQEVLEVDQGVPEVDQLQGLDVEKLKKQCNGVIFEKQTNKVVCMSHSKIEELDSFSKVVDLVKSNDNIRIEYCEDGTLVRLYNYGGIWRAATTRCIDASDSFWTSNKNFDTMFWETFDRGLLVAMDPNFTYMFILLHRENRIVVKHTVNMLVYISRVHNQQKFEDFSNQFKNVYGIKRPKIMNEYDFNTLSNNLANFDCKFKRGIVVKVFEKNTGEWNLYKYDFNMYSIIKSIRGNVPQIRMRYLELLSKPESLQLLEKFYTEHNFMFTFIKASILKLVKTVYKLYVDSHIKHVIEVKDDNMFYRTLRQLHAQYKKTNKPIGFIDVQEKIYSLDKSVIKRLLSWE